MSSIQTEHLSTKTHLQVDRGSTERRGMLELQMLEVVLLPSTSPEHQVDTSTTDTFECISSSRPRRGR